MTFKKLLKSEDKSLKYTKVLFIGIVLEKSPFRKVIVERFASRQNYEDEKKWSYAVVS